MRLPWYSYTCDYSCTSMIPSFKAVYYGSRGSILADSSLAITELHVGVLRCMYVGLCRRDLVVCARPPDRKIRRYCTTPFAEAEQSNHEEKAKVDENRSHLPPAQGSESISWCHRRLLGGSLTFRRILCSIFVDRHKCSPR